MDDEVSAVAAGSSCLLVGSDCDAAARHGRERIRNALRELIRIRRSRKIFLMMVTPTWCLMEHQLVPYLWL